MIFSAIAFAEVTDSNHRSLFLVSPAVEQSNVPARKAIPCNDAHGVGQCCSVLHCLVGIAVAPSVLAIAPVESLVGAETVDSGASLMAGRLDRPPKSWARFPSWSDEPDGSRTSLFNIQEKDHG
jgi:hypothetical protein